MLSSSIFRLRPHARHVTTWDLWSNSPPPWWPFFGSPWLRPRHRLWR